MILKDNIANSAKLQNKTHDSASEEVEEVFVEELVDAGL